MSLHVDEYYLRSISHRFELFRDKGNHVFNVRCPICGDSQKKKNKARGYFYRSRNGSRLNYMCHNCGASMSFSNFLRDYEPDVYSEYVMDQFSSGSVGKRGSTVSTEDFVSAVKHSKRFDIPPETERLSDLESDHPARRYIEQRKIPKKNLAHMFYTRNFARFVSQYQSVENVPSTPRIILPFYDRQFELKGFQGRSMPYNPSELRYITIKLVESFPKIYGLHLLNPSLSIVYVTEGPLDSLFLPNAIAMMGADLDHDTILQYTGAKNAVYIFDNEPRSVEITKRLEQRIDNGNLVFIWPDYIQQKDVNELIVNGGYTQSSILNIIKERTVSGLKAKAMFKEWKK